MRRLLVWPYTKAFHWTRRWSVISAKHYMQLIGPFYIQWVCCYRRKVAENRCVSEAFCHMWYLGWDTLLRLQGKCVGYVTSHLYVQQTAGETFSKPFKSTVAFFRCHRMGQNECRCLQLFGPLSNMLSVIIHLLLILDEIFFGFKWHEIKDLTSWQRPLLELLWLLSLWLG